IKNGSTVFYQPIDVIGSYAVYHSSKRDNKYKTGKAFHIYRPKIIDANDEWVWGVMNISNSVLSITIDQDWLNNAVYPVTVDPTFGYTSEGTGEAGGPGNMLFGNLFTSPDVSGMTGVSMSMYGYYPSSSANVKMLIYPYIEDANYINNGITGAVALTDISSLKTANFGTAPSIAQNTQYLLTVIGSADFVFKCDATGGTDKQDWSNSYATPTNFNWDGGSNIKGSIYCTYEVAEENNAPTQSGEVPANTSTGISLTPICNVTANDA
ncbi:unnamed protein product, partial [marine sediment metagenome]